MTDWKEELVLGENIPGTTRGRSQHSTGSDRGQKATFNKGANDREG
jgi:hypothetical protein